MPPASRKPATRASGKSDAESEQTSERSGQDLDDAEEETLAPRSTKLRAHRKWEELIPKSSKADKKDKVPPKKGPKKTPTNGSKKVVAAADDYPAPQSLQLNTSDDDADDLPKAASPASRGRTIREDKPKSASRESKASEVESRSSVKKAKRSRARNKSDEDEDEASSGEPSEEDEEEEDDQDEEGAISFDAEALYWAGGDDPEDLNDAPQSDASPRHLKPHASKRTRRDSDSDNGSEKSLPLRPSARKKTKPTSDVEDADENRRGNRQLAKRKEKTAAKGRSGEGRPDEIDSEDERARARARARQKEKEKERERAKARAKANTNKGKEKEGLKEKLKVAAQKANRLADPKLRVSDDRRVSSSSKRKHDERVNSEKGADIDDEAAMPPKKRRADRRADLHTDSDDEDDEEIDDQDTNINLRCDKKGRPNLGEQAPRVRRIARLAIFVVKKNVLLKCAFPDGVKDLQDQARSALIRCAQDVGYRDMAKRLKDDNQEDYWRKFASLPAQRAFSLRGLVKKITDGAVAGVYGLQPGCSEKIEWLQRNLAFIYPHDYKALSVQSQGKLAFTLPIFESVLRAAFYDNPRSFGYKVMDCFESSLLERPLEKEIPASMLALVATAVYASLDDYRPTKYRAGKFEANIYAPVFKHCISFLSKMKSKQPNKYHTLMSGLYQRLTGAAPGVADFDDDAFADFSADEE